MQRKNQPSVPKKLAISPFRPKDSVSIEIEIDKNIEPTTETVQIDGLTMR